ncbi:MAG: hypothetical protein U0U70_13175 [Chitinophagaceae bacterium]
MKRLFILTVLFVVICYNSFAQQGADEMFVPPAEWTVPAHKDNLKLTLIIDSIQLGTRVQKINFQRTININFESDYLQVKDDIYIKIFISRNQEYGKKFYSWKWDYLKKKGNKYSKLNIGYYSPLDFNQPLPENGNEGQGNGNEGQPDYLMFYYRYKLE